MRRPPTYSASIFLVVMFAIFPATTNMVEADDLFEPAVHYGAGDHPGPVAIGDFDGDENLDLTVTNGSSISVSVLLGNGDGTFQAAVYYGVVDYAKSVAIGDLDNDGNLDLAVTCGVFYESYISLLLGNGDGTFQESVNLYIGWELGIDDIAIDDLNNDNNLDLVVTITSDVLVLLGNGDGTFQTAVGYYLYNSPSDVAIGDLDGDGNQDLVTSNHNYSGYVSVLLGNGDGTFQSFMYYLVGDDHPRSIAIGDLDGDGNQDLVTGNGASGPIDTVSVLLGNGDGTFQVFVEYGAGDNLREVAIGDLDGDSYPDLAAVNGYSNNVSVLLGNGDGTFQAALYFGVGDFPVSLALGDLDCDGYPDLAVANKDSHNVSVLINTTVPITVSAEMTCLPQFGMLPFTTQMSVTLENLYTEQSRRVAAHIDVTTGDGHFFANWRAGYVTVPAGGSYVTAWSQNLPAHEFLVGPNRFDLVAEDVTPAPYNQPPYPPSGAIDMTYCSVTGIMP